MSAEASGWVYRHSPFKGSTLLAHLAAADSVNDQHDHELWMSQGSLAAKARISRETANRAISELVDRGFLTLLQKQPTGKANKYRFLFPDTAVIYETRRRVTKAHTKVSDRVTPRVTSDHTTCDDSSHRTKEEPKKIPKRYARKRAEKSDPDCPDCGGKSYTCLRCARYGKRESA